MRLLALALVSSLGACVVRPRQSGGDCAPTFTCEETRAEIHVLEGTMTLGIADAMPATHSLVDGTSKCVPTFTAVPGSPGTITVHCTNIAGAADFSIMIGIPDLATLATKGARTFTSSANVSVQRTAGTPSCSGFFQPFDIEVTVEEASGGLAANTVTPDYRRTIRIDVSLRASTEAQPYDVCSGPVTTQHGLSVRLQQTAADVRHRTDAPCPCGL